MEIVLNLYQESLGKVMSESKIHLLTAKRAYAGYAVSTGGLSFDGRKMPQWDELPARIQEAWRCAIVAAFDEPDEDEKGK